jgi:hypothetical protein
MQELVELVDDLGDKIYNAKSIAKCFIDLYKIEARSNYDISYLEPLLSCISQQFNDLTGLHSKIEKVVYKNSLYPET